MLPVIEVGNAVRVVIVCASVLVVLKGTDQVQVGDTKMFDVSVVVRVIPATTVVVVPVVRLLLTVVVDDIQV